LGNFQDCGPASFATKIIMPKLGEKNYQICKFDNKLNNSQNKKTANLQAHENQSYFR
jgi:hypothetical protein